MKQNAFSIRRVQVHMLWRVFVDLYGIFCQARQKMHDKHLYITTIALIRITKPDVSFIKTNTFYKLMNTYEAMYLFFSAYTKTCIILTPKPYYCETSCMKKAANINITFIFLAIQLHIHVYDNPFKDSLQSFVLLANIVRVRLKHWK